MLHWVNGQITDQRKGYGFRVSYSLNCDTGDPLLPAGAALVMVGLRHFQTLIATRDRLYYVGADGRIYAFAF